MQANTTQRPVRMALVEHGYDAYDTTTGQLLGYAYKPDRPEETRWMVNVFKHDDVVVVNNEQDAYWRLVAMAMQR